MVNPIVTGQSQEFNKRILSIVEKDSLTFMEATLEACEEFDIEPDSIGNLLSPVIKDKIKADAAKLNYIPRSASLPV